MRSQRLAIGNIPAILWGAPSARAYIHVHGQKSNKALAEDFARIAERKGFQTLSFDLPEHGERAGKAERCDIFTGMRDLAEIGDYAFAKWEDVALYACSIGAYFSLNAYAARTFSKCLFQSPILDMEYLIKQMFLWFNVTEERLLTEKEIDTPVDLLTWDYYQYVKAHPIGRWDAPTSILYGGRDNLQPLSVVETFAKRFGCALTVAKESEHAFMGEGDGAIVHAWLTENI